MMPFLSLHDVLPSTLHWQIYLSSLLIIILISYGILTYNCFIQLTKTILQAKANIYVVMKQRQDELNKLISLCSHYLHYECHTLQAVTQIRKTLKQALTQQHLFNLNQAENQLQTLLQSLSMTAEANPELKANQQFTYLQNTLSELEIIITQRRLFYNHCVTTYNTRIASIPDNLFAVLFHYTPSPLLHTAKHSKQDINLNSSFKVT